MPAERPSHRVCKKVSCVRVLGRATQVEAHICTAIFENNLGWAGRLVRCDIYTKIGRAWLLSSRVVQIVTVILRCDARFVQQGGGDGSDPAHCSKIIVELTLPRKPRNVRSKSPYQERIFLGTFKSRHGNRETVPQRQVVIHFSR